MRIQYSLFLVLLFLLASSCKKYTDTYKVKGSIKDEVLENSEIISEEDELGPYSMFGIQSVPKVKTLKCGERSSILENIEPHSSEVYSAWGYHADTSLLVVMHKCEHWRVHTLTKFWNNKVLTIDATIYSEGELRLIEETGENTIKDMDKIIVKGFCKKLTLSDSIKRDNKENIYGNIVIETESVLTEMLDTIAPLKIELNMYFNARRIADLQKLN